MSFARFEFNLAGWWIVGSAIVVGLVCIAALLLGRVHQKGWDEGYRRAKEDSGVPQ